MKSLPPIVITVLMAFSSVAQAQSKRGADYYLARLPEYLGKEISVYVEGASLQEYDPKSERTIFYLYTEDGLIMASVPKKSLASFERRYKEMTYRDKAKRLKGELRETESERAILWLD